VSWTKIRQMGRDSAAPANRATVFAGHRSKRRGPHSGFIATALLMAVSLIGACGSGQAPDSAVGPVKMTIAYGAPTADQMIPSVTAKAGIFQKYGIDPTVRYIETTQLLPALMTDQIQLAVVPAPGYQLVALNGASVKAIGQVQNAFNAVLVTAPGLTTPASLDGKAIGISKPGAYSDLLAMMCEQRLGVRLNKVPVGGLQNQLAAFKAGQVDAVGAVSPSQVSALESGRPGSAAIIDWRTVRNVPAMMVVGNGPWMEENRPVVENALRAIEEGIEYYRTHPDAAISVIVDETQLAPDVARQAHDDALQALAPDIVPTVEAERTVLGFLAEEYPAAASLDPASLIDTSYAEAVKS
jgi:ABC-type nitrate/sulfonate/bicarbonate transport system substrate-binding protein